MRKVSGLRWWMVGLIFLATVINYVDRQTVAVLKKSISDDLGLTNPEYAAIQNAFLIAYAASQMLSGRLYDAVGTRIGFTISIVVWSIAAVAHAAARSMTSFAFWRFVLGLGEAGNWPGAAKSIAEWFPPKERALGMGIFNTGAAVGGALSPPLIALLASHWGWRPTFIITGGLGLCWLVLWLFLYRLPQEHPWLGEEERASILEGQREAAASHGAGAEAWHPGWRELLRYRQVWAVVVGRFLTDPIWWLYVFWLPSYFQEARGFSLAQVGWSAWFPFLAAGLGALTGGWASGHLIARGWSADRARKTVMAAGALLIPAGILAMRAGSPYVALAWMGVVLFGFQVWINNLQTLPSDFFPGSAVASVAGLGGTAAAVASVLYNWNTGRVVGAMGYTPVFVVAGVLGPLGLAAVFLLAGRIRRLEIKGWAVILILVIPCSAASAETTETIPPFAQLLARPVRLKPELVGVHPRVFVTASELETLRARARTTHREDWQKVLAGLPALAGDPPPPPGPQERRAQNNVAHAIAGVSLAWAVERRPDLLAAAKKWTLAAIDYEPWGYTYNKPNVDLAAGHLLYAIGWAYDLLWPELAPPERARIRASLERHAALVHTYFTPGATRDRFEFTQNHDFIPTAGLAVAALALMGESPDAEKWAAAAYAHHHRANQLLSPDGYYYEGIEYWIFSAPWLVHFADAWEHATGESVWELGPYRNWKLYVAHELLPNGQDAFDFGDVWEGPLTRARRGEEIARLYPGGTLESNANLLYRVAARLRDPETQAVADRCHALGHTSLEEHWTLLWRDASLAPAPMARLPLQHRFEDSGVVFFRTSWEKDALAFAFKAGPPEGHRAARLLAQVPEWRPSTGHSHPDAGSFIVWANGRLIVGDTGYAGRPLARHHNTVVVGGFGQGLEKEHDAWEGMDRPGLDRVRITEATLAPASARIVAEIAAAYPPAAGLSAFRREFSFEAPGRFRVRDRLQAAEPRNFEWYLHADGPFAIDGAAFRDESGAAVHGRAALPSGARLRTGPTILTAPGQPGSIEQGRPDQRGFELVVEPPAVGQAAEFDVSFEVKRVRP